LIAIDGIPVITLGATELDLFEEARIIELPGASFHFVEIQWRVRLQAGGGEQLLLRVLSCALEADRLELNFLLPRQGKRAKQKQNYTDSARRIGHVVPRLANGGCCGRGSSGSLERESAADTPCSSMFKV
jgi:hypothetical protein